MASVPLANRALAAVGTRSTISSLQENSTEANNVSLIYDPTRQQLLRAAQWNFSKATATLSLLKSAPGTPENQPTVYPTVWSSAYPPPDWSYSYAYPSDCLQVRKVVPNLYPGGTGFTTPIYPSGSTSYSLWVTGVGQKFEVATDYDTNGNQIAVVLSNLDQAIGCYTRDITNEQIWDADFTEAFVMALAGKLVAALTGDKALAKQKIDQANQMILHAQARDGNEGFTVYDHTPDWITRGHGISWAEPWATGQGYLAPYGPMFSV